MCIRDRQEPDPDLKPPKLDTMQDFLDAVRESGMVGLGGAGFPTVVKLTVKNLEQVKAVIINGAECEPYITSDTRTMPVSYTHLDVYKRQIIPRRDAQRKEKSGIVRETC